MYEHPFECIEIFDNFNWDYLKNPDKDVVRRQDYTGRYGYIDGSFYISQYSFLKKHKKFVVKGFTHPFFTRQKYAIDIDVKSDLKLTELILKYYNKS